MNKIASLGISVVAAGVVVALIAVIAGMLIFGSEPMKTLGMVYQAITNPTSGEGLLFYFFVAGATVGFWSMFLNEAKEKAYAGWANRVLTCSSCGTKYTQKNRRCPNCGSDVI